MIVIRYLYFLQPIPHQNKRSPVKRVAVAKKNFIKIVRFFTNEVYLEYKPRNGEEMEPAWYWMEALMNDEKDYNNNDGSCLGVHLC